jgi:short-subunit dehydrogenase
MKIIIAGSSSGIGKAATEKLLSESHHVIGLARRHDKFKTSNVNYLPITIDFSDIENLESKFRNLQKTYPDSDAIICSAGYGKFVELEQFSFEQMQHMMQVNFLSHALLIKTFLPGFKKKQTGKIIILGSECALEGQKKGSFYCASKFALRGFAQSLRKECTASNISVTLINPGFVDTPFFQDLNFAPAQGKEHAIQPEQIASLIFNILIGESNCVYEEINLQPLKKVLIRK